MGLLPGDGQLRAAIGLVAGLVWHEHVAARRVVSGLGLGGIVSLWGITVEDDFRSEGLCQMVMFSEFTCVTALPCPKASICVTGSPRPFLLWPAIGRGSNAGIAILGAAPSLGLRAGGKKQRPGWAEPAPWVFHGGVGSGQGALGCLPAMTVSGRTGALGVWVSLRTWDEGEVKAEPTLEGFLSRAPNGRSVCVAVGHPVGKPPSCGALPLEMSPLHVEALLLPLSRVLPRRGRGAEGGGAPALLVALD